MVASLLALALMLGSLFASAPSGFHTDISISPSDGTTGQPLLSSLAVRLRVEHAAVSRDEHGRVVSVFGLPVADARAVLMPVTRQRALPPDYEPPDLTPFGGRLVRELVLPDLNAIVDAAANDDVELAALSAYRSPDEQALAFESAVWRAVARERTPEGGPIDRAEAERLATRFVAPPGHSQHQLGTAIDFSTWEINYALIPSFAETQAGLWLLEHAWEYGFVLPYPLTGEERSGYGYEPWHFRWVGRELAAILQRDNYLQHPNLIVDDYLRATEELLAYEAIP